MGAAPPGARLVSEHSEEFAGELLDLAIEAARMAGELLFERFQNDRVEGVESKSTPTDLVSEADLASQRAIRELLADRRPGDGFLGEEEAEDLQGSSGLRWVVDPLDGTVNFLFGIPQWCVSVAVEDGKGTLAGAIFDPNRRELFSAIRGQSPLLNGGSIKASDCLERSNAMVATGFAYSATVRAAQAKVLERLIAEVRDLRRFGSAALDLAWTAAGRYDAYFERTVKPWDIAAGELICRGAGLSVLELPVHENLPWGILVANERLAGELLELLA